MGKVWNGAEWGVLWTVEMREGRVVVSGRVERTQG